MFLSTWPRDALNGDAQKQVECYGFSKYSLELKTLSHYF